MTDEIKSIEQMTDESEYPYVKVTLAPTGPSYEISQNMNSLNLFGIIAQLEAMARIQFGQEFQAAMPQTQQQLAIARGIPMDFRKGKRN